MSGGERERVARLIAALGHAGPGVEVGPGDDAAVVRLGRERLVITVDSQREGVHFRRRWMDATAVGARAVAVACSDLGAMGADPAWSVCALAAPADADQGWLERALGGAGDAGRELGCPVVGGDLSTGDRIELAVTAVGRLPAGRQPTLRSGARAGDECWVLGALGRAAAGRALLQADRGGDEPGRPARRHRELVDAYVRPRPPLALGAELASARLVGAMMDISDGLGIDLDRMCEASGVGVVVDAAALADPTLDEAATETGGDALEWALTGGDDYALLCAIDPARSEPVRERAERAGVAARRVGRFVAGAERVVETDGGPVSLAGGWDPFGGGEG